MKNWNEVLTYLYSQLPMYHRIGKAAYKNDLRNILELCRRLGNPHKSLTSIHIGGTNGKGSTSHILAAILQTAGYKTGLFTSPHLRSFTERIKINGEKIPEEFVINFITKNKNHFEEIKPSFFEMCTAMAFSYFATQTTDINIIEVGMGGRLDSTNIISPLFSIITNISFDHVEFLGDSLGKIALEKAGIIKSNTPVIISETQSETTQIFLSIAKANQSPIYFSDQTYTFKKLIQNENYLQADYYRKGKLAYRKLKSQLNGLYQSKNILGLLMAIEIIRNCGYKITIDNVYKGIAETIERTRLEGRWQKINDIPLVYCDVAHNSAGISALILQIKRMIYNNLRIVFGMVNDKDSEKILSLLPMEALYYFCQPDLPRAKKSEELYKEAKLINLEGKYFPDVKTALKIAKSEAQTGDLIVVCGSTFVVAEALGN